MKKLSPEIGLTALRKPTLQTGNIDCLFVVAPRTRERSKLDDFEKEIFAEFDKIPPKTLREAQTRIEVLTGIKRSLPRISAWLL